jgi:adenylate cyclase
VRRVAEGAAALGFVNMVVDEDGVVRRASPLARWGGRPVTSLALATAALAAGETPRVEKGALRLGDVRTPLHDDGTFLVDFRGAAEGAYRRVAPSQLIAWNQQRGAGGALPAEARAALEGAIVVWGVNLSGTKDVVTTPMSGMHRGPALQATVIDDLLRGGGRIRASRVVNAGLLLAVLALAGAIAAGARPRWAPHAVALLAAAATGFAAFAAFRAGISVDLVTPWLGIVVLWGAIGTMRYLTEGRYNRWLEGAFGRYLAPSVIDAIKKDPALLELGGRRREISVLFSDVAGFTVASRKLGPEQIVRLLNEHLTAHCDEVFATGGVVDKFIGDAVMAFWGDPVPVYDHAERACRTALAVQRRLPELEPLWRGMGLDEFRVRIGVNSGPVVVGNMGSRQRFDYTVMGETVNLASRLEGANKAFGTTILLGPRTREAAGERILALPIGGVQVVGHDEPVRVHCLVAMADAATPAQRAQVAAWFRAQEAARDDDLDGALAALAEADRHAPGHGAHAWFRDVLASLRSGAYRRPWSGVVILSSKG